MNWFYFMIGSLATYRLARMISMESGPSFIFRKLRGMPSQKHHPSVKEGLSCLCCTSAWVGIAVTAYYTWLGWVTPDQSPIYWLALSGVAVLLNLFSKPDK